MPILSRMFLRALDVPCPARGCEAVAKAALMLCVSPWQVRVIYYCQECGAQFGSTFATTQAGYVSQRMTTAASSSTSQVARRGQFSPGSQA